MQYILDCVTLLLNVVLCFYLLYGKYPVRSTHMVKRLRIKAATTASQPPEGLLPTAIPVGTEYLLSIDLRMYPMQSI